MARWTLGFLIGVVWITHFAHLPSVKLAYLLISFSIILISLVHFKPCFCSNLILFFSACYLGFSWSLIIGNQQLATQLPKQLEGKRFIAKGKIITIPESYFNAIHFDFLIQSFASSVSLKYPIHVRIKQYFYKKTNGVTTFKKGDIWQLPLRLHRARGFWNPGSFDYQIALFTQNISATGYLLEKLPLHLIQHTTTYYFIDNLRQKITENVKKR